MIRRIFLAGLAVFLLSSTANAGVIFGLLHDPATTAGGGTNSNRSGDGTWHLYALDDGNDLGMALYNVTLANQTSISHRSPITNVNNPDGDPKPAGWGPTRSATNINPLTASQPLFPSQSEYPIGGFGQEASDFVTKIGGTGTVVGPTTNGAWGSYTPPEVAPRNTANGLRNWLFLAEGAYNFATGLGPKPTVLQSSASVYAIGQLGNGSPTTTSFESLNGTPAVIPEPASLALLALAFGAFGVIRRRRS